MLQKFFGENKFLMYFGVFSIFLTFISNFIGVLSLIVPIIISVALIFVIAVLPTKNAYIYGFFIVLGAWFSYNNTVNLLFFLFAVAAISIPIGIGLKKRHEFKAYMLYAIICLTFVLVAGLVYDTFLLGISITLNNVIDTFFKPTYEMAEIIKHNYEAATLSGINIDETINMYRNMSIGIVISIAILQTFVTYLLCAFINRYISAVKENMMYPIYNFKAKKIGGILFVIATLISFFSAEGSIYLISLNFYIMMQFPMALCGLCSIYKLMELYKLKQKTKRLLMTLILIFMILPIFNLLGSVSFIGGVSCILDITNINTRNNI